MTKEAIQPYVFYISRGKVFLFQSGFKNPLEIVVPDTVIKDLEIKKISDLENLLTTFVQQNKITVGPVFIILAPEAVLEKTLPTTTSENLKVQIEENIKLAPFNHVGFTSVVSGKDTYLILVNRELFEGFQETLERLGFHVSAVTPARTLGITSANFDSQMGYEILKKSQLVYQNSFTSDPDRMAQALNNVSSDPRRNKKLLLLLVAFGGLIVILGGLLVKTTFFPDKTPAKRQAQTTQSPASTQAPTPALTPLVSASPSATLATIKVQVLNASGETGLAQSTKTLLTNAGFALIDTGNATTISADRIQVVFRPDTTTQVREEILKALSKNFTNPATRDGENPGNYDVVITLTDTLESGT